MGGVAKLNLKDAYSHTTVHPCFQKFLDFQVVTVTYQFQAVPFGLNIVPWVFIKLVLALVLWLTAVGILVCIYLDDWLVWGKTRKACH